MISIDQFEKILETLAEELPTEFYEQLNGGIIVDPGHPLHPADESGDLYIMGEYRTDPAMGKYIVMYYAPSAVCWDGPMNRSGQMRCVKCCGMSSGTILKAGRCA